jgi:ABC-2 type transport system permease protein
MNSSLPVASPGALRGAATWFSTLGAMTRKELLIKLRYPLDFVAGFIQVFLMVAIFTLASLMFARGGPRATDVGSNIAGVMVYGFVVFIFVTETLFNIGYNVRREQKQGTFEQLYLSPASKSASLVSRVLITLLSTGLLSGLSVWLMSALVGNLPFAHPALALFIFVMVLAGTFGIGFAFAALTLRLRETAQILAGFLQFGFMLLCAPFYPFKVLPVAVKAFTRLIPLSYGVDAFRSTLMGYPPGFPELASIRFEVAVVTAFGLLMPAVGLWLYRREENHARRNGSLFEH